MFWRTQSLYAFGGCYLKAEDADKGDSVLHIQRSTTNEKDKDQQTKTNIS